MTGHKPFSGLTKDFSLSRKAKIASLTNQLREEMTLQELREELINLKTRGVGKGVKSEYNDSNV
jgi:hypothetical protein